MKTPELCFCCGTPLKTTECNNKKCPVFRQDVPTMTAEMDLLIASL